MIDNKLLKDYLESWLDNVGRSGSDDETIMCAMTDTNSLLDWGLVQDRYSEVDYDYDCALDIISRGVNDN